jgi:hypothetical protein
MVLVPGAFLKKNLLCKVQSGLPNFVHHIYFDGKLQSSVVWTIFHTLLMFLKQFDKKEDIMEAGG